MKLKFFHRVALAVTFTSMSMASSNGIALEREHYAVLRGSCDGYPRLDIGTIKGMCAGLVSGPTKGSDQRKMSLPRSLVQLDDRTWLVTDLGSWDLPRGIVWKLQSQRGEAAILIPLLRDLNLPHALSIGPDGLAYVGEMSRIIRFDPRAPNPADTIEVMIAGLPDNKLHDNRHPLSKFVFAPDGSLLVNIGAPSDQCVNSRGQALGKVCPESEEGEQAAIIRRYARISPGQWAPEYTVHVRGLRNSVALAVHASGTILQAENSYDFASRWSPFEELNVIRDGRHYGWPYCADIGAATPAWKSKTSWCKSSEHERPAILLPPHTAPLDMLWYDGAMFPSLEGRLLMSWHGYRSVGGRIASYAVDANGVPVPDSNASFPVYGAKARLFGASPAATPVVLTPGWGLVQGKRPQGSPVGLAIAKDGAIWTTDDRAGLVIRFARDQ